MRIIWAFWREVNRRIPDQPLTVRLRMLAASLRIWRERQT